MLRRNKIQCFFKQQLKRKHVKIPGIAANFYTKDTSWQPLSRDLTIFSKALVSWVKGKLLHYPGWSQSIWHRIGQFLKIRKTLKNASEEEARYAFDGIARGIDCSAKGLQLEP